MSDPVVFEHDWKASEMARLPVAAAAAASECLALHLPTTQARAVVRTTLCQLVQESGLGRSENARLRQNFYGAMAGLRAESTTGGLDTEVSAYAIDSSVLAGNREFEDGRSVVRPSPFYHYRSLEDSTRDHVRYITGFTGLTIYADPPPEFAALCDWLVTPPRCYATDPEYPQRLKRIDERFTMIQYVDAAFAAQPQAPQAAPQPRRTGGLLAGLRRALNGLLRRTDAR